MPLCVKKGLSLSKILSEGHKNHPLYVVVNHGVLATKRCKMLKQMDPTEELLWLCLQRWAHFFLSHCFSCLKLLTFPSCVNDFLFFLFLQISSVCFFLKKKRKVECFFYSC